MKIPERQAGFAPLATLYQLYEEALEGVDMACQKKCSACCTCNMTLTRLEAMYILNHMDPAGRQQLRTRLGRNRPVQRFVPQVTTNGFARLCMEGALLPEEENDPSWGACPLLEADLCTIYAHRPFGCRALISRSDCRQRGYADIPSSIMTVNHVLMQVIEHLDAGGWFGNFSDLMGGVLSEDLKPADCLLKNEPIPMLMVPPEHRRELTPLLNKISDLLLQEAVKIPGQ